MPYYNRRNAPSFRPYRLRGLGADEAISPVDATADAAAAGAAAAVAAVDVVAMQAEMDKLKKENEALKKAMGKFWAGAAAGVAGSWLYGKWRRRF